MHPLILLLALFGVALLLPSLALLDLLMIGALMLLVHGLIARAGLARVADGVWRIRYLLAAIAVLYLGLTPGEPAWSGLPGISREGLVEGSRRALVLVDLLIAVYLLLATTPPRELTGALRQLLAPLSPIGVPTDRIARRIAVTLASVPALQAAVRDARDSTRRWPEAMAALVRRVEAGGLVELTASIPCLPRPSPIQWLWLLPVLALLIGWPR